MDQPTAVLAGGVGWAVNERQGEALASAQRSLQVVQDAAAADLPIDMWTIDLHDALHALGEIGGHNVDEAVLDSVFSRFCIGK